VPAPPGLLQTGDALRFHGCRLEATDAAARPGMERLLSTALAGSPGTGVPSAESLLLSRLEGQAPLAVLVAPLRRSVPPAWGISDACQ
jgi:hypothetical protein